MNNDQIISNVRSAMKFVGINYPLFDRIRNLHSQQEADKCCAEFKQIVKKRRRELAKLHHPDISRDRGEQMKQVNNACDFLLKMKIVYQPPVQQQFYFYYTTSEIWGGTTTATSYF